MIRLLGRSKMSTIMMIFILVFVCIIAGCSSQTQESNGTSENASNNEQVFPEKPIKIIVPWSPGGTSDMQAQLIAPHLEQELGVAVLVECIPGASGVIGVVTTKQLPADGYTMLMTDGVGFAMRSFLEGGYGIDDFVPIGADVRDAQTIAVRANSPYESLEDIIEAMKQNPGQIKVGAIGPVAPRIQFVLELEEMFGVEINAIPYTGEADVRAAILGGHIDAGIQPAVGTLELVEDGEMRILAVGWDERLPEYPDVPTVGEISGRDIRNASVRGYYVRTGTPQHIIDILTEARDIAAQKQDYITELDKVAPYFFMNQEEFTEFIKEQEGLLEKWVPIMQSRFE